MSPELAALVTLVAIQVVFGLTVTAIVSQRTGSAYILSSRGDASVDITSGFIGRMHRARINNFEALAYFTPTVVLVEMSGANSAGTAIAAWVFIAARFAFLLCYALDLVPWRSVVWLIGIAALTFMLGAAVI